MEAFVADDFGRELGEQIKGFVDSALGSRNFQKLNKEIDDLLRSVENQRKAGSSSSSANTSYQDRPQRSTTYQGQTRYQNPYTGYQRTQQNAQQAAKAGRAAYNSRQQEMMYGQRASNPAQARQAQARAQQARAEAAARAAKQAEEDKLFARPENDGLATGMTVTGIIGLAIFLRVFVGNLVGGGSGAALAMVFSALMMAVSGGLMLFGRTRRLRAKRFRTYVSILKKKLYATVSDLGKAVGKSDDFVRKELHSLIDSHKFKQGHLDDSETTMIASDALYEQYRITQRRADELRREKERIEKEMGTVSAEVREVLDKGNEYVQKIRETNDALPDPDITSKLNRLEMIITKIFARVKEAPEEARNLSQFMDYYLPTTWKLVSAYREMEEMPVQGENILSAKEEIRNSLDTINDAYETLLDSMFKDKAWDVSTDISVMKSMMKQDGLTGSDFKTQSAGSTPMGAAMAQVAQEEK